MDKYKSFLLIGKLEGYSYLLLLFVAMPMKYFMHKPEAVTVAGLIHGALFILFMYRIMKLYSDKDFTFRQSVNAFILSIVPFGTFYLKRLIN